MSWEPEKEHPVASLAIVASFPSDDNKSGRLLLKIGKISINVRFLAQNMCDRISDSQCIARGTIFSWQELDVYAAV